MRLRSVRRLCVPAALIGFAAAVWAQPAERIQDSLLQSMRLELERSRNLLLPGLDAPYFIEYAVDDVEAFGVAATLGALLDRNNNHLRAPRIQVRVGGYEFDNTNYALTDFFSWERSGRRQMPLDDVPYAMRRFLWLETDRAYKGSLEAIARKRAALKNLTAREELQDFHKAEAKRLIQDGRAKPPNEKLWTERVKRLSALLADYPQLTSSQVDFEAVRSVFYLANSEGTLIRHPETLYFVRVRASGLAADGMPIRDAALAIGLEEGDLPGEEELARMVRAVGAGIAALSTAPVGEPYSGPVLFEGEASGQLLAQLLGANLGARRRPISDPGRPAPFSSSELETRLGARVMPEWMDVSDEPNLKQWQGKPLPGHYVVDMEGISPEPLKLVEAGVLKNLLTTRQAVRGTQSSNGRARLPGSYGAKSAVFGNLLVRASGGVSQADLRKRLMETAERMNRPYGIVIRKLDFPTSAGWEGLRRMAASSAQRGGGMVFSPPVLAYRVYPDGREELVRGLRFRGLSVRVLRDILAASAEPHLFNFLANAAPLSMMGAGGYVAPSAVVAPSLLFEDIEIERADDDLPVLPIVPPPAIARALR